MFFGLFFVVCLFYFLVFVDFYVFLEIMVILGFFGMMCFYVVRFVIKDWGWVKRSGFIGLIGNGRKLGVLLGFK